jgi:DNA repair exonuclease SbcCD ATPase subunit
MKEGYLQMKISEFNDKLTQLEQLFSVEESKIRLMQEKVGEYKEIIKKLQDVQEFKNQAITEIRKENEAVISNQIQQISQRLSEMLKDLTTNKAEKMNETIALLQKREAEIITQAEQIQQHTKQLIYLSEHNDILMMKLANRKVINEHDVVEMQRRATKKAEQTE